MDTRKPKRAMFWLTGLSVALVVATRGQAIGIGDSQVKSALNQPLNVSLPILDEGSSQILPGSLQAHLASREDHARAGLQYPVHLQNADLTLFETADGRQSIIIRTHTPVAEPLLTFLVQLDWSHGRLLKEVSVLLDPPGYQQLPDIAPAATTLIATAPVAEPVAAPLPVIQSTPLPRPAPAATTVTEAPTSMVAAFESFDSPGLPVFVEVNAAMPTRNTQVQPLESPAPASRSTAPAPPEVTGNQYGPVRSGDTLMEIAAAVARQRGGNAQQIAQAIYQANRSAFGGSMNSLNRGAFLTIPADSQRTTVASSASAPTSVSGFATISDLFFNLPAQEVDIEATTTVASSEPVPSLNIMPADSDATSLARELRDKLTQDNQPETPAFADSNDATGNTSPASEASALPAIGAAESATLVSHVKQPEQTTAAASAAESAVEQSRNNLQVDAGQAATLSTTDTDLSTIFMKWLPWVLLALAVPVILMLAFRRRETPITQVPSRAEALNSAPPQRKDAVDLQREREDQRHQDAIADSEFDCETVIIGADGKAIRIEEYHEQVDQTAEVVLDQARLQASLDDSFNVDDLTPSLEDTQESIRPEFTQESSPPTELLQRDASAGLAQQPNNNELDLAQEAEIYLAYGQYMLAENNITKLRRSAPDNDRYKMLELKLFADTGKHGQMNDLADDLLGRFSDPASGIHQQIRKICERAAPAADDGVAVETPKTIETKAQILAPDITSASLSNIEMPALEDDIADVIESPQSPPTRADIPTPRATELHLVSNASPTEPMLSLEDDDDLDVEFGNEVIEDESHSILDALDDDDDESIEVDLDLPDFEDDDDPLALDDSSVAPTEPATHIAASFEDDIEDYLHEHDQHVVGTVTPFNREEPLADSLGALELSDDIELDESAELEFNELTEEELDAISMDIELLEGGDPNTLELESEFAGSTTAREIESFTDTDYRLTALGRKPSETEASERLDLPFDLEQELEKLSRPSKSAGGE